MDREKVAEQAQQQPTEEKGSGAKTVVIIPAFNEERFIGSVVLKARHVADVVLVVDDGSSDNTSAVAEAAGATVLRQVPNQGKGAALRLGFRTAAALNPDVTLTVDADGQHVIEEIDRVARPILDGEADIVIGSRYLEKKSKVPHLRVLGHRCLNFLLNHFSGTKVTDSQSGFRAYSPRALQAISFRSNGFSVESEMQFIANKNSLRLVEAPITVNYLDRSKRPVIAHGLLVLSGLLALGGQGHPLLLLAFPGATVTISAGVWSLGNIDIFQARDAVSLAYALFSGFMFLLGNTLLTIGLILYFTRALPAKTHS